MKLNTLVLYFILGAICTISSKAQSTYFPPIGQTQWATISPGTQAYCKPKIDSLYNYLEQNNTKAFILLKDGKIVLEKYFGDFTKDSSWYWMGADKTLTASLFGIAQSEKLLNVTDRTQKYLGEGWTSLSSEHEAKIRIVDQLKMTSGLDKQVTDRNCIEASCLKFKTDAGTVWSYYNAPFLLLDNVLKSATSKSLNQFLFNSLRASIGLSGSYSNSTAHKSFRSNTRAAARFGLFLMTQGKWNNKLIVSDQKYFKQMTSSGQKFNAAYGYGTWINGQESYQLPQDQNIFHGELNPYAPSDMFAAFGENGQLINVVPSEGIVWVRFGNQPEIGNGSTPALFNNNIWKRIQSLNCESFAIGADESNTANDITPKSSKDVIQITTKTTIQKVMIADQAGKIVFAEDINSKKLSINLKQFSEGTYYARIYFSEEIVSTQKFIVK